MTRSTVWNTPIDIASRRYNEPLTPGDMEIGELIRWLKKNAFANGYAHFDAAYTLTITSTASLIKTHRGNDDRLIRIYNNDVVGGNVLTISNESTVSSGLPILPNTSEQLLIVPNDTLYGISGGGDIEVRILEFKEVVR